MQRAVGPLNKPKSFSIYHLTFISSHLVQHSVGFKMAIEICQMIYGKLWKMTWFQAGTPRKNMEG